MPRCAAFLRAVNVGGRRIKMDALRTHIEALGLTRVSTFIASGNVIFDSRARDFEALERRIQARLSSAFGFEVDTFVRTTAELVAINHHAAFAVADVAKASTFVVGFLAKRPDASARQTIERFNSDTDRFHVNRRELYWLSRNKQSESAFSNAVFERAIGMRATFRGINTLRRLIARLPADA